MEQVHGSTCTFLYLSDLMLLLSDLKRENPERVNFFIFIRITPLI